MIEDVKVPSIDGATRAIRALSTCQNFNPEHDVYANMCYITAESVSYTHLDVYKRQPFRFEAGTPAIIEAHGLGLAIDWINQFDRNEINAHEQELLNAATNACLLYTSRCV